MKKQVLIFGLGALTMMSCENPMTFRTKVNEDGSLDKTITFDKASEWLDKNNIFNISAQTGWTVKKERTSNENDKERKFRIEFNKHFASADEMNRELDAPSDTLFHVYSKFEKKFRWFYTYIRYSETFRPINRFKMLDAKDFFNREDSLFIQRMPPEGSVVSTADSVYLQMLNEKITERFANMAIYKEVYDNLTKVVTGNSLDKKWLDSLGKQREEIYKMIEKDQGGFEQMAGKIFDSLRIPIAKQKANKDFETLCRDLKSRTDFMGFTRDGRYVNIFEMPWSVVSSNADSVSGNNLYWRPLVYKFVYMDYEMYAECRKMNWWAMAISVTIVALTVLVLKRKNG